jgi:hypothetical protein
VSGSVVFICLPNQKLLMLFFPLLRQPLRFGNLLFS